MRIAFQKQLLLNAFWQNLEDLEGLLGETLADEFILLIPGRKLIECLCLFASQQFIDSGIMATPKFMPFSALVATESAM